MKSRIKLTLATGATVALAVPAMAFALPAQAGQGQEHSQAGQGQGGPTGQVAGPNYETAPPPQAKAYGRYCQGESKKHVKGEQGTAFSRCVKTMAQAAKNEHKAPGQVCKGKSKKHVKGEQGTEFSRCVKAVAQLRRDERREEQVQQS